MKLISLTPILLSFTSLSVSLYADKTVTLPNGVTLEMVSIPAGTFTMGSPENEAERRKDETAHPVKMTVPFWLGKYEVTQAQWDAVMENNPSHFKGPQLPVEMIKWSDAAAFCAKLTEREHAAGHLPADYVYTLPTEAQWEYACRAGTTTTFNTGDNLTTAQANYDGNSPYNGNAKGEFRNKTTEGGTFPPNAWGLCDMHGNVWEWCLDSFRPYPKDSETDPVSPLNESQHIARGGSWINQAHLCRAAFRNRLGTGFVCHHLGFRLALCRSHTSTSAQETIHLFNGKNLDGWYTFLKSKGKNNDPDKVFTAEDGVIHISGTENGGITTNEEYENDTLEVEYKASEQSSGAMSLLKARRRKS
ncbi:MAG: SUMF1/EgtB/PvdO family nonheme iron enzyme [Planctomycetaceae bacterium]|jgi:formylglycine-generating enzyme required for sulfatase activity|nr:SUMF1/EgtB/PvdO family nonheme iron enzyme [Planctomycetaceae bacterium]